MTFILLKYMSYSENVPPKKQFSTFPKQIGEWHGTISYFDQSIYNELGVDDSILISYLGPDKKQIQVYVGYYQSQKEGSVIHSPKNCMPGSGWEITSTITEEVKISGSTIELIRLVINKGLDKQVVLYWFQERGRYISSEYWQKIYLVWDAIFRKRSDGSFVRLIATVDSRGEKYAADFLKSFVSELTPILNQYIPGETK
ncbi:MAG: EpsI family protein [Desulfobacterium sp.]|nr:EpsI family protein [Desulfobacterium sp.]